MAITACYTFFLETYEYIPVVSTFTSIVHIFNGCIMQKEDVFLKTHYFTSLRKKTVLRVIILIIPVFGNVLVAIYDFKKYGEFVFTLKTVQLNGLSLEYASEEYKNNITIVTAAVKQNVKALQFASDEIREREKFINECITQDITAFYFAGDKIRQNESFVTAIIDKHGINLLRYAASSLQNNKAFIMKLLKKHPIALKYAPELRKDKEFVVEQVLLDPLNFRYAHPDLRKDKELVKKLMVKNIKVLGSARLEVKRDEAFILEQMLLNKEVLKYSPLSNDKIFISKRLKTDLSILSFASDQIRYDKIFISQFKGENFKIFQYVSEALQSDIPYIISCMNQHGLSLQFLSDSLRNNRQIVLNCVKNKRYPDLKWMGRELFKNDTFAEEAVSINGVALNYFHESISNNEKNILIAIRTNLFPLSKINSSLQDNEAFFRKAVLKNAKALRFASEKIQNDRHFVLSLVMLNQAVMKYCRFSHEYWFITELVMHGYISILKDASDEARNDETLISSLLELNVKAFQYASDDLRKNRYFIICYILNNDKQPKNVLESFLKCADDSVWYHVKFIKKLVKANLNPFICMSEKVYRDKELIMNIILKKPNLINYLRDDYKKDCDIIALVKRINS